MSELIGKQLDHSTKIAELVGSLSNEVAGLASQIDGPRDPQPEHLDQGKSTVDRIGELRGRPLFYPYVSSGMGRGPYVELTDGSVKLDLINGIGIHVMGHSHPEVMKATIEGALQDSVVQGHLQPGPQYLRLAEKIVSLAQKKSRLKYTWLTTSGSMANENALKIIRQKNTPRRKIIAMNDAFAGRTTMMAEITDNPAFKVGLPSYNEVLRLPFYEAGDSRSMEKSLEILRAHLGENKGEVAAFMFEPVQGEGGFKVGPREYFIPLIEECKKHDVAIWVDEVQTFCRTGEFFAFEKLDLGSFVDICTVAKTAQTAATLYTEEYNPKPGLIAGTFAGSSAALSAGHKILEILENGYTGTGGRIEKIHEEFTEMLEGLIEGSCQGLLSDVAGMGLMVAVTPFDGSKEKMMELLKVLFKNGLMCFGCGHGPYRLRFLLPAVLESDDIQRAGQILEKSLKEMA